VLDEKNSRCQIAHVTSLDEQGKGNLKPLFSFCLDGLPKRGYRMALMALLLVGLAFGLAAFLSPAPGALAVADSAAVGNGKTVAVAQQPAAMSTGLKPTSGTPTAVNPDCELGK
jgi:hypothetical protein